MTPEEQRIAIAKAWPEMVCRICNYPYCDESRATLCSGWHHDPLKDLNACFEMEKYAAEHLMDADQWEEFGRQLERMHPSALVAASELLDNSKIDYHDLATLITGLTAAQRCEAFCRVMWSERWKK